MTQVSRYLEPTLVEHLNHLELSARSVVEGSTTGQHRSPVKGASVEFRQHRFYAPGDEPRRIDWRVYGRTDRPYVKEYDEETNLRAVILLDRSGSMAYGGAQGSAHGAPGRAAPDERPSDGGGKFDFSARLAAALSYLMLAQTESVGLGVAGAKLDHWLAPHAGHLQLARVLDTLDQCVPAGPSGIASAMHAVADRLERRALVIVLSDFFAPADALRAGLAHLRHGRHEVIAVQVVHRDEEDFPFQNWVRFKGLEGEPSQLCEPALARKRYQDRFAHHRQQLEQSCQTLRAEFQTFTTEKTTLEAVRLFLAKRAFQPR